MAKWHVGFYVRRQATVPYESAHLVYGHGPSVGAGKPAAYKSVQYVQLFTSTKSLGYANMRVCESYLCY